ncbi:hypothetical protein JHK85_031917 [Glycine max]|nr:hypothetical protein JHK85_031917 [Glycine max]
MEAVAAAFLFAAVVLSAVVGSPVTLTLERAFPSNDGVELSELRARDSLRHRRMLQSTNYVVDFPVKGTFDPSQVGLYYTKVKLGTPPRELYVQIDTGSDVLWVSCGSCNGCPQTSGLQIQLNYFDPGSSSTSSLISCLDRRCRSGVQTSDASCSGRNNQCTYTFQYGDGSGTSGYYVSDLMHFASIFEGTLTTNSSASVVFGCSILQTGDLTKSERAVDGIFGFGQQGMSVISQLSSQGIAPRVFSHCLKGDNSGGGVLVLGEIVEPNIVYSPLVPSQYVHLLEPHYNLNLQSISVNGQIVRIAPSVFATSNNRGTIVDSGTTLAYLAEEAYNPFVIAGEGSVWCIGFQKISGQSITILGDLVLKDKIFVYDLAGQRIGWANYDCSLPVNVSASAGRGRSEFVDAGELSGSSSLRDGPHMLIKTLFLALFMHITLIL